MDHAASDDENRPDRPPTTPIEPVSGDTTPIEPVSLHKTPDASQAPPIVPHGLEPYPQPPTRPAPPSSQEQPGRPQPPMSPGPAPLGPAGYAPAPGYSPPPGYRPQGYSPQPAYAPAQMQVFSRPPVSTAVAVLAWIVAAITLLYMLPWAVAVTRNRSNMAAIGLVNLLLGWSFIGWVVSLVMACGSEPQQTVVVNSYGPPPPRTY